VERQLLNKVIRIKRNESFILIHSCLAKEFIANKKKISFEEAKRLDKNNESMPPWQQLNPVSVQVVVHHLVRLIQLRTIQQEIYSWIQLIQIVMVTIKHLENQPIHLTERSETKYTHKTKQNKTREICLFI